MGDESLAERIVRIETQMQQILEHSKARQTREWAIVTTGLGLILTIIVKNLGWLQ
jgi:hypothetical protein